MKQIELKDLKRLVSVTEYADLCNLNRNSIHTRIKREKNPLPTEPVDPVALRDLIIEKQLVDKYKEDRPKFWKGLIQSAAKGIPIIMVDYIENKPGREHTGRKIAVRKSVGPAVKAAQEKAIKAGYGLIPKKHGYRITKVGDPNYIGHVDNLPQFYDFLKNTTSKPVAEVK